MKSRTQSSASIGKKHVGRSTFVETIPEKKQRYHREHGRQRVTCSLARMPKNAQDVDEFVHPQRNAVKQWLAPRLSPRKEGKMRLTGLERSHRCVNGQEKFIDIFDLNTGVGEVIDYGNYSAYRLILVYSDSFVTEVRLPSHGDRFVPLLSKERNIWWALCDEENGDHGEFTGDDDLAQRRPRLPLPPGTHCCVCDNVVAAPAFPRTPAMWFRLGQCERRANGNPAQSHYMCCGCAARTALRDWDLFDRGNLQHPAPGTVRCPVCRLNNNVPVDFFNPLLAQLPAGHNLVPYVAPANPPANQNPPQIVNAAPPAPDNNNPPPNPPAVLAQPVAQQVPMYQQAAPLPAVVVDDPLLEVRYVDVYTKYSYLTLLYEAFRSFSIVLAFWLIFEILDKYTPLVILLQNLKSLRWVAWFFKFIDYFDVEIVVTLFFMIIVAAALKYCDLAITRSVGVMDFDATVEYGLPLWCGRRFRIGLKGYQGYTSRPIYIKVHESVFKDRCASKNFCDLQRYVYGDVHSRLGELEFCPMTAYNTVLSVYQRVAVCRQLDPVDDESPVANMRW